MAAKSTRPPKTLATVKSSVRRKENSSHEYANFFRIGTLELERHRREKEREIARQKIATIDERLAQIDQEICSLLKDTSVEKLVLGDAKSTSESEQSARQGFNLKY